MYHHLLKEKSNVYIADGPIYNTHFKFMDNVIKLDYDTPIGNHSIFRKFKYKDFVIIRPSIRE